MRFNSKYICIFTLSLSFIACTPAADSSTKKTHEQKLAYFLELAESIRNASTVPGVGLAIVYDNEVVYTGGLGLSNVETNQPVTENTLFKIGSNTKAFTGVLAAKLAERGQLEWKKPIINYLPNFKLKEEYVARHMNIEDAFIHMTGLARRDELWLNQAVSREEVFKQVESIDFEFGLREEWSYNNHMYVVAGKALENISGRSWEQMVREEILGPLEMTASYATFKEFMADKNKSTGYYIDGLSPEPYVNTDNMAPAGAISSTPNDIAKWLKMMTSRGIVNGDTLIKPAEYDYLTGPKGMSFTDTCTVSYYTIGWGAERIHGKRILRHNGAIGGQNARVVVRPDEGFGIFIMTNQVSDYKNLLADYAENIFIHDNYERDAKREYKMERISHLVNIQINLFNEGLEAARAYHDSVDFRELEYEMNGLGNALLAQNELDMALMILELNAHDNPESSQAFDNYGKALLVADKKEEAMEVYRKSVALDSTNENARRVLEGLSGN